MPEDEPIEQDPNLDTWVSEINHLVPNDLVPDMALSVRPEDPSKMRRCLKHVAQGQIADLMVGYMFTEKAPGAVSARFVCEGVGRFCLGQCLLRIEQLDVDGIVVATYGPRD